MDIPACVQSLGDERDIKMTKIEGDKDALKVLWFDADGCRADFSRFALALRK
jgi:hypothetical protein